MPALLFFIPITAHTTQTEQIRLEEKKKIELEISKHQINIQKLDEGLLGQKDEIKHTRLQEKGLLWEIEKIDRRLNKTTKKLDDLQKRMQEQHRLISSKEKELKIAKEKRNKVQLHLQKRMSAYYKLGKIDLLNITFSTQTLPELLRFHDSFQGVLVYDQKIINEYRDTISELESAKETLTLERGLLEEFIFQAGEEKIIIQQTKAEEERLLAKIKSQQEVHQQAVKEIKKAQDELTSSLLALKKKNELFDQGFLLNKSKHIPPVKGKIVSFFNQERINEFGLKRKSPGLSFEAADGTRIKNIYEGTVIFAGYLRGYGNTVIVDHGYQYFTIISRIERILATKGKRLQANSVIGIMGATATLMDKGLYFEIRHKDKSVDPLKWLDREFLAFGDDLQLKQ